LELSTKNFSHTPPPLALFAHFIKIEIDFIVGIKVILFAIIIFIEDLANAAE
jgi:hypothetical protein